MSAEAAQQAGRTIGEILLSRRLITYELLEEAVAVQQETGKPLGQVLVETGAITRLELASALAEQWGNAGTISPTFPGGSEYVEPAGVAVSDTAAHLAEIRRERRALEARMHELDRAGVDVELHEELRTAIDALDLRVDRLEAAISSIAERDETAVLDAVHDTLAGIGARIDAVEPEIAALHEAVGEAASAAMLRQGLAEVATAIDAIAPRIEQAETDATSVAVRMDDLSALVAQALTELRQSAEETGARHAELAERLADSPTRPALEAIESALEDVWESIAEMGGRPVGDPALAERVEELAHLVEQLAARPAADPSLSVRIDELVERLDLGAGAVGHAGEPDPRVDALIARVAELASRPVGDPELEERFTLLSTRLDDVAAREHDDGDLRKQLADLAARIEALDERPADPSLGDRLDVVVARLDEVAARPEVDGELHARIEALAARLDELAARPTGDPALEDRLAATIGRLDQLADRPTADPEVEQRLSVLAKRLDAVSSSAAEVVAAADGEVAERLEALGARLAAIESEPAAGDDVLERLGELDAAVRELRSSQDGLSAADIDEAVVQRLRVIDHAAQSLTQELTRATAAWAEDRRDLEARLEWLAARFEAELATPAQATSPAAPTGRRAAADVVPASDGDVEKLRMAVERLMLDFAEHRRAFSAALPGRDLEERVRQLTDQVGDLLVAGPPTNGAGPSSGGSTDRAFASEVRALTSRLDEVETATVSARDTMLARLERMMGTIDWRLQRLEKPEP